MYKVRYDSIKNRIYVTVDGSLTLAEIDVYTKEFFIAVDRSKPGFTVLVDNTNAAVNTPQVTEKLEKCKEYAVVKGLKNSAFVVNSLVFKMQMKRLFSESGNVFDSVMDADRFLDTAPDIRSQMLMKNA